MSNMEMRTIVDRIVEPPPGITPIYNNSPHLRTVHIVLVAVGLALSTSCLVMRLYTKARLLRKLWWDDVCIILAWIFSVATQAVIIYGYVDNKFGIHSWDMTATQLTVSRKLTLALWTCHITTLAFSKFAVLMLYHLLRRKTPRRGYIINSTAAFIASYSIALIIALILACRPVRLMWDGTLPGSCRERGNIYLAAAIANMTSDILLILIPIPMVRGLVLPLIQKVCLMFMFGIGCLTLITSILRLGTVIPMVGTVDQAYKISITIIPVIIESNFIIVCATLPYLRHFLRYYRPHWIGESSNRSIDRIPSELPRRVQKSAQSWPPYDAEMGIEVGDSSTTSRRSSQISRDGLIQGPARIYFRPE